MKYNYARSQTRAATGYYACAPDPAPPLKETLALLSERPLDTFLRRYALQQILQLEKSEIAELADGSISPGLASLFLEAAALAPELGTLFAGKNLEKLSSPWHEATPLLVLAPKTGVPADITESWRQNIRAHAPLPQAPLFARERLEEIRNEMARRGGVLARLHAQRKDSPRMPELLLPPGEICAKALNVLEKAGILAGPEMRHEASLCPIALLREWKANFGVRGGLQPHQIAGTATAYGRGLSLAQARVSCLMEIVERASAHAIVEESAGGFSIFGRPLVRASYNELRCENRRALNPAFLGAPFADEIRLYWLRGEDSVGAEIYVPAQAAYLFLNLDEPALFEHLGSTGLGAGACAAQAKLAALLEVIERDAHATTPFDPANCFELASSDEIIQPLLEDYRWRGIRVQFQDITTEIGVPAFRCFVQGRDGAIAQATGARLSGAKAVLAALTETPWPYSWANPMPSPSGCGLPDLPRRVIEELPDYELGGHENNLRLLEDSLLAMGLVPVYVNLGRPEFGFPVYRAFIPGLETDADLEAGPSPRLLGRVIEQIYL